MFLVFAKNGTSAGSAYELPIVHSRWEMFGTRNHTTSIGEGLLAPVVVPGAVEVGTLVPCTERRIYTFLALSRSCRRYAPETGPYPFDLFVCRGRSRPSCAGGTCE